MNRRPLLYALVFILGFTILDRIVWLKMSVGFFFISGILMFFFFMASDYWFLGLIRDSNVRLGITGVKNMTPIGPADKRCIGKCGPLYDNDKNLAYPPVGIYPRGGLSSDYFLPLQGGGRRGYDIIPEFGLWSHEDGGHQVVLLEPYRVKNDSIPPDWREVLETDRKYRPDCPLFFYFGAPKHMKRIRFPRQLLEFADIELGDMKAQVARAEANYAKAEQELKGLWGKYLRALKVDEIEGKKGGLGQQIKEAILGDSEGEPSQYERPGQ